MYFVDQEHRVNFEILLVKYHVSNNGEYRSALYVLALPEIYRKAKGKFGRHPFDWMYERTPYVEIPCIDGNGDTYKMLEGGDVIEGDDGKPIESQTFGALSSGYRKMVRLAGNLYNSHNEFNLTEGLNTWDNEMFDVFLQAVAIRTNRGVNRTKANV